MKILLTGFDPFGGDKVNPAYEAVKLLPKNIAGADIVTIEIPTVYQKSGEAVEKGIRQFQPDVVICIGQAGGRSGITVEMVAVNIADFRIADNEGNQPLNQSILEDGENAYFATVPVKAMVENIKKHGIPARISYTAGTFVCNDVLYELLYMISKKYPKIKGGFIHVPFAPEQVLERPDGTASMPVETSAKALEHAIEAVVREESK
ncbi:Pyrrolidone-carboxylate peptidase [Caprobacter fermentans]|uniref:Pyrrolidone-carboxylate peptidase n=1 Tax=Caproicibacter fermentans TaxID=2576756 RepID=A0A6N8I152_9FIRM|nr:pyroglutamyl-peptidase I [Caproicibacter fermentans]MVB11648.1 Pyrrolidone-carboxylate peptidase [Caproicibacter fermentans]OCN00191.1 pyroglutamyl-peptidase I [Clostridium sp. W14A]QNK41803.1 pyroglutamyl-peptidase I [Caproicibacter fermentans]